MNILSINLSSTPIQNVILLDWLVEQGRGKKSLFETREYWILKTDTEFGGASDSDIRWLAPFLLNCRSNGYLTLMIYNDRRRENTDATQRDTASQQREPSNSQDSGGIPNSPS